MTIHGRAVSSIIAALALLVGAEGQVRAEEVLEIDTASWSDAPRLLAHRDSSPFIEQESSLHLVVRDSEAAVEAALAVAESLGGRLDLRDGAMVRLRVPASNLVATLDALGALGDVTSRVVRLVNEDRRIVDLRARLENAEALRAHLLAVREDVHPTAELMVVETELARYDALIVELRSRFSNLAGRQSTARVLVRFESLDPGPELVQVGSTRLPFPWLDRLGLEDLLRDL